MRKKQKKDLGKISKDNRGVSLTELLAAFAVSAIVLAGIAYLLITSLRLSGRNNVGAEVQSEVQTTMNLILDEIMEAEGVCMRIAPSGSSTECLLLGDMDIRQEGRGFAFYYQGNALVADDTGGNGTLYLAEFPNDDTRYGVSADGYCRLGTAGTETESILDALWNAEDYVLGLSESERLRYLLGRDILACEITPVFSYGEKTVTERGVDVVKQYFAEPLIFSVMLHVKRDYGDGIVERRLEDRVSVRNRIQRIYLTKKGSSSADVMEIYEREQAE